MIKYGIGNIRDLFGHKVPCIGVAYVWQSAVSLSINSVMYFPSRSVQTTLIPSTFVADMSTNRFRLIWTWFVRTPLCAGHEVNHPREQGHDLGVALDLQLAISISLAIML